MSKASSESESVRIETDSMGPMRVPADAYYGAQTARAVENFPISGLRFPRRFIRAIGLIKKHAARTNASLGLLPAELGKAIEAAAEEVAGGRWDGQFVVDVFQTGSGTSTNMNANEVIANRALELLHRPRGSKEIHPNDHVNHGQSSNDVIPSAIHVAAREAMGRVLQPALEELHRALARKADEFNEVIKIGRTHLQDATPMRLGQEFGGYAAQIEQNLKRLKMVMVDLEELALGGTAVGTGINTHPEFAPRAIEGIASETDIPFRETANHFAAQACQDAAVAASGVCKTIAVSLIKIADDIRWLGSGPRLGLGEIQLPATQPGSSIMPGKVNPVMAEMLLQVSVQVIGNDAAITLAGSMGQFELNTMLPLIAWNLLQSIELLASGSQVFARRCVEGLQPCPEKCAGNIEQTLALGTALVPAIGYDKAAHIAKVAYETNRTIREVAREISGLSEDKLQQLLDAKNML